MWLCYNTTMKDNIIQFPSGEIRNPLVDPGLPTTLDVAGECLEQILIELMEYGYEPTSPAMRKDLGVILNMLYASIARAEGKKHFLHEVLDEMHDVILDIKSEVENDHN